MISVKDILSDQTNQILAIFCMKLHHTVPMPRKFTITAFKEIQTSDPPSFPKVPE